MSLPPSPSLLDQTLRAVARRYRLPPLSAASVLSGQASPATILAIAIEQARAAVARGETPDAALKRRFIDALARMIREAMRAQAGDPAFQAMVLRHRAPLVREYASLSAHAGRDRRQVHAAVNAIAHPAKRQRISHDRQRVALARLHAAASSASWSELQDAARCLLAMPEAANAAPFAPNLARLPDNAALERLRRLEALASNDLVRQYRSLWNRNGPPSGSSAAVAQGAASQRRGAAVEAAAARAIEALARRLNESEQDPALYRVATSMRVPASIPGSPERAKSEWDVVLLRRAETGGEAAWDICLLVEVKASVDAATTDLPRLLRGLRLLSQADPDTVYPFETREGTVLLRGASLGALTTDEAGLAGTVLYCSDAPAETGQRPLGAASRMQLLSAPASLEFASALAGRRHADPHSLEPVWHELLESPRWDAVLRQHPMLRQVRELMVHTDDLLAAVESAAGSRPGLG